MIAVSAAFGLAWCLAYAAAFAVAGWGLRSYLLAGWRGVPARLAEVVIALALVTTSAELLGSVGLFRRLPLLLAAVVAGGIGLLLSQRAPEDSSAPAPAPPHTSTGRVAAVAAVAAIAIVAAVWTAHVASALSSGITDVDSLHYHLPFAARFAQDGWVTRLHFTRASAPITQFHPATSELLHGIGIVGLGSDVLSPLLNVGWLAMAFMGAWCAGRARGVGAACMVAVALVAVWPVIVVTQAGAAENDIVTIALLVAAAALFLISPWEGNGVLVAAAAGGLALGTKLTMVVPITVLTVLAVVQLMRARRVRGAVAYASITFVTGGFWYLRNLVRAGSPVPSTRLRIAGVGFPSPPLGLVDRYGFAVAHYAADPDIWRRSLLPGVRLAVGSAWPATIALAVAGVVIALAAGEARDRVLGVVALAALLAYVITPTTAGGRDGAPILFAANLRYLAPGVVLALVLLPMAGVARRLEQRWAAVSVVLLAVVVVTAASSSKWPVWLHAYRPAALLCALVVVAAGVALLLSRAEVAVILAGALVVIVGLVTAVGVWLDSRRSDRARHASTVAALGSIGQWAEGVHGARIAIDGFFVQYPLYGPELSNHVQYLGATLPHGGFRELDTCRAWWAAVTNGRFDYVVLAPSGTATASLEDPNRAATVASWMDGDPRAEVLLRTPTARIYRVRSDGRAAAGCQ